MDLNAVHLLDPITSNAQTQGPIKTRMRSWNADLSGSKCTPQQAVCCVLTSSADVDVQVALDDRAALERLGGIYGVDDLLFADLVTQAVAG